MEFNRTTMAHAAIGVISLGIGGALIHRGIKRYKVLGKDSEFRLRIRRVFKGGPGNKQNSPGEKGGKQQAAPGLSRDDIVRIAVEESGRVLGVGPDRRGYMPLIAVASLKLVPN